MNRYWSGHACSRMETFHSQSSICQPTKLFWKKQIRDHLNLFVKWWKVLLNMNTRDVRRFRSHIPYIHVATFSCPRVNVMHCLFSNLNLVLYCIAWRYLDHLDERHLVVSPLSSRSKGNFFPLSVMAPLGHWTSPTHTGLPQNVVPLFLWLPIGIREIPFVSILSLQWSFQCTVDWFIFTWHNFRAFSFQDHSQYY